MHNNVSETTPPLSPFQRRAALIAALILGLVATAYAAKGLRALVFDKIPVRFRGSACDMEMRWSVMHYLLRGKNPREIYNRCRAAEQSRSVSDAAGIHSHGAEKPRGKGAATPGSICPGARPCCEGVEPDIGPPSPPDYPPWAYFTAIALMWPSNWQAARVWFAACNVLAIAVIGVYGCRVGRRRGWELGLLFATASLAMGSLCATLGNGQFGLVVVAALIAALWFDEGRHPILAGIALGVALFKPTLSLPFLIPFFLKRRWTTLTVAAAYIAVGSGFIWWCSGVSPLSLLSDMKQAPVRDWHFTGSHDLLSLMGMMGWNTKAAIDATAITVVVLALGLLAYWRNAPMSYLFAITAVAARLWTYHRSYDDVILVFLLVAVGEAAIYRRSLLGAATFAALIASLLPPRSITDDSVGLGVKIWLPMIVVWIVATGVLLVIAPRRPDRLPDPHG